MTDPGAFAKPWTVTQNLQFGADTDMVEAFCETDQSHWIGRLADVEHDAVTVPLPHSETFFMATNGLSYDFDPEGNPATFIVERHVSGDWRFSRQPER